MLDMALLPTKRERNILSITIDKRDNQAQIQSPQIGPTENPLPLAGPGWSGQQSDNASGELSPP